MRISLEMVDGFTLGDDPLATASLGGDFVVFEDIFSEES